MWIGLFFENFHHAFVIFNILSPFDMISPSALMYTFCLLSVLNSSCMAYMHCLKETSVSHHPGMSGCLPTWSY